MRSRRDVPVDLEERLVGALCGESPIDLDAHLLAVAGVVVLANAAASRRLVAANELRAGIIKGRIEAGRR